MSEEDNNINDSENKKIRKTITGKHVAVFLKDGFKKAMSVDTDTLVLSKRIKRRTVDLYSNFKDILAIFINSFLILFYFFVNLFRDAKKMPVAFRRAADNNFRLGLENLKKNNLIDARIRLLLSDIFYNKSSTTKYYIAYVYYRQNNFTKSLKYLKKSLAIKSDNIRAIELLKLIEDELNKKSIDN